MNNSLFKAKYYLFLTSFFVVCNLVTESYSKSKSTNFEVEYLQSNWTTEDGLPQNSINQIIQTRNGYLWLATFGGLARFDGIKFTTFNSGNTFGLMNNRIISVCETQDGTIWFGGQSGELMKFKDGNGKTYTIADGLPGGDIMSILEDNEGTIWLATTRGLVHLQNERFIVYNSQNKLPDDHVWDLKKSVDGSLWAITRKGLVQIKNGIFSVFYPPEGFSEVSWLSIVIGKKGNVWVNTKNGVTEFSNGKFTSYINPQIQSNFDINMLFEDKKGDLWIKYVSSNSLYKLTAGKFTIYETDEKYHSMKTMFEDHEGNLWFGTDGNGLIQLRKRNVITYSTADGLLGDSISAVLSDDKGGIWVTSSKGLSYLRDGLIENFTDKNGLLSYELTGLCLDSEGNLWIGSNLGLSKFKDGKFINYTKKDGLIDAKVNSIFEDREGNLWIGTDNGLNKMSGNKFLSFQQSDGLINNNISFINQTSDGSIWIGTFGGLSNFRNGKFINYSVEEGLSNNFVRDMYEETDGTIWIGTYGGGLNRLKDGKLSSITSQNGLFNNFISRILSDEKNNLWILSNRGIFKNNSEELNNFLDGKIKFFSTTSFGVADGMLSSEGNGGIQPAGWKTPDGKMWFPTIKGIVAIDSHNENLLPPSVIIENIVIDQTEMPISEVIEINPNQENIEIQYTGINFNRPKQIKFKYKLIGLDTDWVDVGTRRSAYFSHLPQGNYTFEVMAENGDGVLSHTSASIRIIVYPPFWLTWWFGVFCAVIFTMILFGIFRFRIAQLEKAKIAQETFSRRLINAHETERSRIAAELHDGLGHSLAAIKNMILFVAENNKITKTSKQELEKVSEQTAQAIKEVREISYNLRPSLLEYLGLSKAIRSLLKRISATGKVKIISEIDEIDEIFNKEVEISIYRIIQEGLNNILKHAEANNVIIEVKKSKILEIKIQDDGKGFEIGIKDSEKISNGFGLIGMAERVKMIGGTYSIKSELDKGTIIEIKLKLNER